MQTIQPPVKRGRDYWDRINMPTTEFKDRIQKIKQEMKEMGVDVLLLYGTGVNEYGNPCYVSNFINGTQRAVMAILPSNDEIALMFHGFARGLPTAQARTWVEDLRAVTDVSKDCVQYLKEKNLIPSTIGIAGVNHLMPYEQLHFLRESIAECRIVDFDQTITDLRKIKSPREYDQICRASRIIIRAINSLGTSSQVYPTETILASSVRKSAFMDGAEDVRLLLARPRDEGCALRPAEDRQISTGDTIILYLAVEFERYWSEGIRTLVLTDTSSLNDGVPDSINQLYERIAAKLTPGKTISQFCNEMMSEIGASRLEHIPDYGLGQGIGLSPEELPLINAENAGQLEQGMCLTMRLAVRDKQMGAVMIGNTINIAEDGLKILTARDIL